MLRLSLFLFLLAAAREGLFAQSGFVKSGDQPIPGATVTVIQASQTFSTVTDRDGHYAFPPLADGTWTAQVDMFGFDTFKKDVDYGAAKGPVNFDLQLAPSPVLERLRQFAARRNGTGNGVGPGGGAGSGGGRANGGGYNRGQPGGPTNGSPTTANRANGAGGQQVDTDLQNALNSDTEGTVAPPAGTQSGNEAFLVSGSLSPGVAQGGQADSGPDMRFVGQGANGMGAGDASTGSVPGFATGNANGSGGAAAGGGGGGFGGGGGPGGGGGGFGGGGFGGRGGGGGFGGGRGGQRRPGQTAGAVFGNRRRRNQQIHGQASFSLTNSAVDAKPFSLNGLDIPQAAYAQSRFSLIVGGPLVIPKIVKDPKTQFFLTYFGTRARNPKLFTETVPTAAERTGDFSQATQSLGTTATNVPVTIFEPGTTATRTAFPNNVIPTNLLNPVALTLLRFYPLPNQPGTANNYQFETAQANNTDNVGVRLQRSITSKDRLSTNVQYQRRDGTTAQPFGYSDTVSGYGINTQLQWTRNLSTMAISNAAVTFNRNYTQITPYFSTMSNIAAELGIQNTSSNPLDYGPPTLNFTNFASLSDSNPTLTRNQRQGASESISLLKGTHSISLGVGYTRSDLSARTDPNGRGTLNFTGQATSQLSNTTPVTGTGYDLADFLIGDPQSSSIQYGQTDYFRQNQVFAYAQDEWKVRANLTLIAGVRYEFFSPFSEKYGRLANLDVSPEFNSVSVVWPANNVGPYTGAYPSGLINPDYNNFSPRLALAWKITHFKKSTVVRAGYGIYYNGQAYQQFATLLSEQYPFATSRSVNTSVATPLTLTDAFAVTLANTVTNNFAVNRNYRTPYAGTWNFSVQRDLGGGFFTEVLYMGTKGTGLDVRIAPNLQPAGTTATLTQTNQLGNASGFVYDQSVGNSMFNALHVRVMRRFNRGISVNALYQYAKSIDDSSTLGGGVASVAQNWQDISAERGLSSFDIRHQLTASFVWTSPVGGPGNHMATDTAVGRLLKDWQLSGAITAQTGQPLTARVLGNTTQLAQTNGAGSQRANSTGLPVESGSGFFDLSAFAVPAEGAYGNAGRNTIPGPGLFNFNLAFARSFNLSERRRIEFRLEGNNVLNHVNYTSFYTVVNSVNYGLPSAASTMRTLNAVVRFRF